MLRRRGIPVRRGRNNLLWALQQARRQGGFSPLDISGLQLWLDASDVSTLFQDAAKTTPVTVDDDPVGAWVDKSTNSNDVTQSTDAKRGTYKTGIANGLPVVRFDGIADTLGTVFASPISQPMTVILAFDDTRSSSYVHYVLDGGATGDRILHYAASAGPTSGGRFNAGTNLITNFDHDEEAVVLRHMIDGASSEVFQNGVSISAADPGANDLDGITIAAINAQSSGFSDIDYYEILIYSKILSAAEVTSVENYLLRWGIM